MRDHADLSRAETSTQDRFGDLIGEATPMRRLYELIERLSGNVSPVLLLGETGTGKELVARCIHSRGARQGKPFVPIDCSALSPELVESEIFGHVKGAFTGAAYSHRGLLKAADTGTLFLDEIGELPLSLQAKLLRALQEKEIRPVGSTERFAVDVRIIAATNRDLDEAVRSGTFRQDLFFRLNVVQIRVPPLRDRKMDIPLLVSHFLANLSEGMYQVQSVSDEALKWLIAYDWPGNVRELQNAIERAVALSSQSVLSVDDFGFIPRSAPVSDLPPENELLPMAELERRAILRALRETGGDKQAAARLLGIGKTTLYRKLRAYEGRTEF